MSKETTTFQVDSKKREELDELAASLDRDRSYVLNEAIDYYLEMHRWQIEEIQKAITEADARDFASDEEINAVFARLMHKCVAAYY